MEQQPACETPSFVKDLIQSLVTKDDELRALIKEIAVFLINNEILKDILRFSGSCAEGAATARWFQRGLSWQEVELDIMYELFTIQSDEGLEAVDNRPGFVKLRTAALADVILPQIPEKYRTDPRIDDMCSRPYISPMLAKEVATQLSTYRDLHHSLRVRLAPHLAGLNVGDLLTVDNQQNMTETTSEITVTVRGMRGSDRPLRGSIDNVPCARLPFWPRELTAWRHRAREWPSQTQVEDIVSGGCHLVPKSSPGGDTSCEWRLSLSFPEEQLAALRSPEQKTAYFVFKILFYKYLKPLKPEDTGGKGLFSFVAKTTMLWVCEERPPTDPVWTDTLTAVTVLLTRLERHLASKHLPNYFLPDINLLEPVDDTVLEAATGRIAAMCKGHVQGYLWQYVPFDLEDKCKELEDLVKKGTWIGTMMKVIGRDSLENFFQLIRKS